MNTAHLKSLNFNSNDASISRSSAEEAANVYADRGNSKKSVTKQQRRKPPDPWNNLKMERFWRFFCCDIFCCIDDISYERRIYFKAYKAQVILSFVMDIKRSTWLFPISYNTICCEYCIIWLSLRDSLDIFENCSIFGVLQFSANEVIISLIKAASY